MLLAAAVTRLGVDSEAQAEQVRSIAIERVGPRIGAIAGGLMAELDDALRLHLAL